MKVKTIVALTLGLQLYGCSVFSPYQENFSCRLKNNFGKCVSVEDAYVEAVSGLENEQYLVEGETIDKETFNKKQKMKAQSSSGSSNYNAYKESVYKELSGLIDEPVTPMIKPPKTVRTLILPYSQENQKNRIFMPRFVYSIVEEPEWVMGEYLYDQSSQHTILNKGQF